MIIGAVLAIAYVLFAILFRVDIREYVGTVTLWPGLVLILAGTLARLLTIYFQPADAAWPLVDCSRWYVIDAGDGCLLVGRAARSWTRKPARRSSWTIRLVRTGSMP